MSSLGRTPVAIGANGSAVAALTSRPTRLVQVLTTVPVRRRQGHPYVQVLQFVLMTSAKRRLTPEDFTGLDRDESNELKVLYRADEDDFLDYVDQFAHRPDGSGRAVFFSDLLAMRTYDALTELIEASEHRIKSAYTKKARTKAEKDRQLYSRLRSDARPLVKAAQAKAAQNRPERVADRVVVKVYWPLVSDAHRFVADLVSKGLSPDKAEAALRERLRNPGADTPASKPAPGRRTAKGRP